MTDAHQQLLNEQGAGALQVTQLQGQLATLNAGHEQLTKINQDQSQEITTLHQSYNTLALDANRRIESMVEHSAIEKLRKTHATEVATSKVTYDHHVEELSE